MVWRATGFKDCVKISTADLIRLNKSGFKRFAVTLLLCWTGWCSYFRERTIPKECSENYKRKANLDCRSENAEENINLSLRFSLCFWKTLSKLDNFVLHLSTSFFTPQSFIKNLGGKKICNGCGVMWSTGLILFLDTLTFKDSNKSEVKLQTPPPQHFVQSHMCSIYHLKYITLSFCLLSPRITVWNPYAHAFHVYSISKRVLQEISYSA